MSAMKHPLNWLAAFALVLGAALAAPAHALGQRDLPTVTSLAHQLENAAEHAYRQAAGAPRIGAIERDALRDMDRFAGAADRFHDLLEGRMVERGQAEAELTHMNRLASRIDEAINRGRLPHHALRDWDQVTALLQDVNRYF